MIVSCMLTHTRHNRGLTYQDDWADPAIFDFTLLTTRQASGQTQQLPLALGGLSRLTPEDINMSINASNSLSLRANQVFHLQGEHVKKAVSIMVSIFVLGFSPVQAAENRNDTYDYATQCPDRGGKYGKTDVDSWRFYKCECVSYVADKLNERGVPFNNSYKGQSWGNASNWLNAAKAAKISYSNTPKLGSIAFFSYGHVAYVTKVNPNSTVTISEYNNGKTCPRYDFCERTIKFGDATSYIHF